MTALGEARLSIPLIAPDDGSQGVVMRPDIAAKLARLEVIESFLQSGLATPADLRKRWTGTIDRSFAGTFFLLDQSDQLGVERFVHRTMPRLLQQLSHSTEQVHRVLHGQVRGRVLWGATYKARLTEEYNPTVFACAEVHHRFDNPENQLLKYLVERIAECLKALPVAIRQGLSYLPPGFRAEELLIEPVIALRLEALETALNRLHGSVRLREIDVPNEITEFHILRAKTSRLEEYQEAAELYERYKNIVILRRWESLAEAAQRGLPLPVRLDEPAQRWIGLAAALYRTPV